MKKRWAKVKRRLLESCHRWREYLVQNQYGEVIEGGKSCCCAVTSVCFDPEGPPGPLALGFWLYSQQVAGVDVYAERTAAQVLQPLSGAPPRLTELFLLGVGQGWDGERPRSQLECIFVPRVGVKSAARRWEIAQERRAWWEGIQFGQKLLRVFAAAEVTE